MFCKNCGAQFEDGQAFCPSCGTAVSAAEVNGGAAPQAAPAPDYSAAPDYSSAPSFEAPKSGGSKILPIALVAAVIALVIVALTILLGNPGKKAVKKYYKAIEKFDEKKILEMTLPKEGWEEMFDKQKYDYEDYVEAMSAAAEALLEELKDEGKVKFEYEIKEIEKIGKLDKLKGDVKINGEKIKTLEDLQEALEDDFEKYDLDAEKIKKAYAAEVKWTLTVDKDKAAKDTDTVIIYKYGSSWYVNNGTSISEIAMSLDSDDYDDAIEAYRDELKDLYK